MHYRGTYALLIVVVAACGADADSEAADAATATNRGDGGAVDGASPPVPNAVDARGAPPEVLDHASDWPLPNRDYDNTRAVFDAEIDSSNVDQLEEVWRVTFEIASPFGYFTSNPLILGDTVFIQDMGSEVQALDRNTGRARWSHREGGITVGPNGVAVGWGKVFADIGDTGVIALDASDGSVAWRFEPPLVSSEGVDIQPTVHDGRVFVSTVPANLTGGYSGGSRGVIFALDQHDGQVLWRFDTVDSDDIWGDPERNAGGGAWYPPLVDTEGGMTYWGTGNPAPWPGTSEAPSGRSRPGPNLYTSGVLALDAESGELAWFHQERLHDLFDWDFQNTPIRVRADLDSGMRDLVIGSGKTGTVVALDAESGELVWRANVGRHENDALDELPEDDAVTVFPGLLGGVLTAKAYADGVVYVPVVNLGTSYTGSTALPLAGATGELVALNVRDGNELWSAELAAPCYGAATVVNDLVLTSDGDGRVYALSREDGSEVWHYDASGGINAPLAVAGDLVLVPAGIGHDAPALIALRLPD